MSTCNPNEFSNILIGLNKRIHNIAMTLTDPNLSDYEFNQIIKHLTEVRAKRDSLHIKYNIPNIQTWAHIEFDKNEYSKTGSNGRPYKLEYKKNGDIQKDRETYRLVQLPIPQIQNP